MTSKGTRQAVFDAVSVGSGEDTAAVVQRDPQEMGDSASVSGVVTRDSTNYDVDLVWQDSEGNDIITESVASGVTAGNNTSFDVAARSSRCKVKVSDANSGSGDVDGVANMS